MPLTADCTFSKARTSICRTRSRDTPNSAARSSSVIGSSGQAPRLEDAAFSGVEHADGAVQRLAAMIELLVLGHDGFLVGRVIDQPVLPFAGLAVVADRRVERRIAAEPAVHVDHVLVRDAEALGNQLHLVGVQITLVQRGDLALGLAQVEEQLLLVRGGAHLHERPRTQDVLLYRRLDPPHGVGSESKTLLGLEPLHRLHQADIAFRDDLGDRQAVAAIAHGDLGHEPEMAGDKVMCRVAIVMFAPTLGEHVFLLGFQHREFADLGEVTGKAGFSIENRQGSCTGHFSALQWFRPPIAAGPADGRFVKASRAAMFRVGYSTQVQHTPNRGR